MKRNTASAKRIPFTVPNLEDSTQTRSFRMRDPYGFHARPAALFAKTARQYAAEVMVGRSDGTCVNGKSILSLMTLAVQCGDELLVRVEGADAAEAMAAIERLFADAQSQQPTTEAHAQPLQFRAAPGVLDLSGTPSYA